MRLSPDLPPNVRKGDVIGGKYRVEQIVGMGGMGVVVAAWHLDLKTRVALKILLPAAAADPESVERFVCEARAACRLKSQHAARVLDVGRFADGLPYMVMEFLVGHDLGYVLETEGRVAVSVVVEYVLQACEAVAEAHALGIVHRDLKPRNLFLAVGVDGQPFVKVLDFGLAKSSRRGEGGLTGSVQVFGTPQYMSPEQMRSTHNVDLRTDIWSLGVCLYELLTGAPPFNVEGASVPEVCLSVMNGEPAAPRSTRAEIPEGLASIIMRCLEKKPERRFAGIGELVEALEAYAPASAAGATERVRNIRRAGERAASDQQLDELAQGPRSCNGRDTTKPTVERRIREVTEVLDASRAETLPRRGARIAAAALLLGLAASAGVVWATARPAPQRAESALVEPLAVVRKGPPTSRSSDPATPADDGSPPTATATRRDRPPTAPRPRSTPAPGAPRSPGAAEPTPLSEAPAPVVEARPSAASPPKVEAPPRFVLRSARVNIGPAFNTSATPASSVNRTIGPLGARLTACYREALPGMTGPVDGSATLHVETDDEGVIIDARVDGALAAGTGRCIAATARGQRIANVDTGRARADIPLAFTSR